MRWTTFGLGLSLVVGCSAASDGEGDSDSDGAGTNADPTFAESGAETGETGGPASLPGSCALGCSEAADCCLAGVIDCPGDFPNDWTCEAGLCRRSGCQTDEQCGSIGNFPNLECHPIAGVGSCFDACVSDLECVSVPDSSCVGEADDGARYCDVVSICQADSDCAGQGVCDLATGVCGCGSDQDCSGAGLICAI